MLNEHENLFIKYFILPHRQNRWREKLVSSKGRGVMLHRLAHNSSIELQKQFVVPVDRSHANISEIESLLKKYGAGKECWVMAEIEGNDGKMLLLRKALSVNLETGCAAVLSCIPGRLCFYQAEATIEKYILYRK